jgi:V/A-type H+-transporting ATPase subunit C
MNRIKEEDYAYAVARIRAIESRLMDENKLNRLLEAPNSSDALKLLTESGYGSDSLESSRGKSEDIDIILSNELRKTYDFLLEIIPEPEAVKLFMRRYDYLNTKLILKAEFLGIDVTKRLSPMGTIEPDRLYKIITERKLEELPEILSQAITDSIDEFSQSRDPQDIDFILDRASYKNMVSDAIEMDDPFLIDITNKMADLANIRVFIRAKLISRSKDFIKRALIDEGTIRREIFEDHSDKSFEDFFATLKKEGYERLSAKLSEALSNGISEVEKVLDDMLTEILKKSKFMILGIEPVVAYMFYKETEVKNARLIITGKNNNIPNEIIKERLRLGYA